MNLPPYSNFPNITGDKISLKEILPHYVKDLIDISFYDAVKATTLEEAAAMQKKINKDYDEGNTIHWAIADTGSNNIVGTCGYYRGFENATGELGCILLPEFRGQGYMTAAIQLAIDFGINNIGLKRVCAITTRQNIKAIKLLERLNFIKVADLNDDEIEFELKIAQ